MAKRFIEKSEYWFDPTAIKAIAQADRNSTRIYPSSDLYHATPNEIKLFQGYTFPPDQLMTDKQLKRLRYKLNHP